MNPLQFVASVLLALALPASAADAIVGLNFCNQTSQTHISGGTADGFSGWTDSRAVGDATSPAVQATPLALGSSGVSVTWSASGTWSGGAQSNTEQALYRFYLNDGGSGVRVTITGLSAWMVANAKSSYRIRTYASSDYASSFYPVSIVSGSNEFGQVLHTMTPVVRGDGNYPTTVTLPSGNVPTRGYVDSPDTLTADTITLTIPARSSSGVRGSLAAFKITAATPILPPEATTAAATLVTDISAQLNDRVKANGANTAVSFQYGLTTAYSSTVAGIPATATGTSTTTVRAPLAGLATNTTYHFRAVATNVSGTTYGADMTFTTASSVMLTDLSLSEGTLKPAFGKTVMSYTVQVPFATSNIQLTPVAEGPGATIRVQGAVVASGASSDPIALASGATTTITTALTAAGGTFSTNYVVAVTRLPESYVFNSSSSVPLTATGFDATGETAALSLNFAPAPGTFLTVVNNTGLPFIQGRFANLAQGQQIELSYNGVVYWFVANYYGGSGNDLVLQWANVRVMAWGYNSSGQLGNGTSGIGGDAWVPTAVNATRLLAGKTVISVACGDSHSFALCSDGTLAGWGSGDSGKLGNGDRPWFVTEPVAVDRSGVLAGKTIVAVAAGNMHSIALCSDGTVAAWGENSYGQLGDGSTVAYSVVPVAVLQSGVLADRTVVAIAAGTYHNLALCADGALVAWGGRGGELGDGSTVTRRVPVLVDRGGALAGKTVVAIAAGGSSSLAVCADGLLAAWGFNGYGQLGNGAKVDSTVPVAVAMTGALSGKTIRAAAVNWEASYALCSDGSIAAWGRNNNSALGNNSTTDSLTPVAVYRSGVLASKTITGIAAEGSGAMALCADGSIVNWGENTSGQLGNNSTTSSLVPVLVSTANLKAGERFAQGSSIARCSHSLALAAEMPPPLATTLAATEIHDNGATFNASAGANGGAANVTFEYGLTTAYGMTAQANPAAISGTAVTELSAAISDLPAGTTYHFRVVVTGVQGVTRGEDQLFTTTALATLASLTPSASKLTPTFAPTTNHYTATVPSTVESLTFTPLASLPDALITVNGAPVASGTASPALDLTDGENLVSVTVSTADGEYLGIYTVRVTRVPRLFRFTAPEMVGVTVAELTATGSEVGFELAYAPEPGTSLMVVDHTGLDPISGVFDNLAQGQVVELSYGGTRYQFVANYFGGSGNDLVLQWANTRIFGWGDNGSGQLGNNRKVDSLVLVLADHTGVLAGKIVTAISAGQGHSLALCADGTLATWGDNEFGQLGNGTIIDSSAPVLVSLTGVLAGKTVIAVTAGDAHNLALCSDGTLAAWGNNYRGQLGIPNSTMWNTVPVLVDRTGVLAGKTIVAIAASGNHSVVLCSDGAVAAWGCNYHGQLGDGTTTDSKVPVWVDRTGVLLGKAVIAIGAGGGDTTMSSQSAFSLVLCSDGTLAAWGAGGLLGDGGSLAAKVPVLVDRSGVLAGKTVSAINVGQFFTMALGADGQLAAWGSNYYGQLGNNSTVNAPAPIAVSRAGVLAGKTVASISGGESHSLACCIDGTLVAWGNNTSGALGNNSTTNSLVPVEVNTSTLSAGARSMKIAAGFYHNQALVGLPPPPIATTLAADEITDSTVTLRASVNANGGSASLAFEYGLTDTYGSMVAATPTSITGLAATDVSASVGDLVPGATYHFRLVATGGGGAAHGEDREFTTSTLATLASLGLSSGTLAPDFSSGIIRYGVVVPNATDRIALTPVAVNPAARVRVDGVEVVSGTASEWIGLAEGNNDIVCDVIASDENALSYTVTVTRLPETYTFSSANSVPVTVGDFTATGHSVNFSLAYAPVAGSVLTVVQNTGMGPILGTFDNLAQGQVVKLSYAGVTYSFVANYFGGTGNDLVLQWGHTRLAAWGYNDYGALGNGTAGNQSNSLKPVPVDMTGVLAGKTVTTITSRNGRILALCADGTLATWGLLSGSPVVVQESRPVAVPLTGALSGKTVVAIAAGYYHNLALCSDGTLAAWGGDNYSGEWGNGGTSSASVPVLVYRDGVLKGKSVIAVAAHAYHSLALCSDGTVAAWGRNGSGILGNGTTDTSLVPVLVDRSGVLAGKVVTSIASGTAHALALCSDGTVAAWGEQHQRRVGQQQAWGQQPPGAGGSDWRALRQNRDRHFRREFA